MEAGKSSVNVEDLHADDSGHESDSSECAFDRCSTESGCHGKEKNYNPGWVHEVCKELTQSYQVECWPGTHKKKMIIVAFAKCMIAGFPTFYKGFKVKLLTDNDNSVCREPTTLTAKDKNICKKIIAAHGPKLMTEHSNLSMIIMSSYRLKENKAIPLVCIALFCRGKGVIPLNETFFPSSMDGIEVDVREGYCSFGMRNAQLLDAGVRHPHLRIGVDVGISRYQSGTLGGFVPLGQGDMHFLTCAHVVVPNQCLIDNDSSFDYARDYKPYCRHDIPVFQPAKDTTAVGEVSSAIFTHSRPDAISVDAALVCITDASRCPVDAYMTKQQSFKNLRSAGFSENNPPKFPKGEIITQMDEPRVGHMAIKCGATTGLTSGLLPLDGGIFRLENRDLLLQCIPNQFLGQPNQRIVMYGQYLVEFLQYSPFFKSGDSGSLVFMHDGKDLKCLGMAIGDTTHGGCIVTPIEAILGELGINYSPPFHKFEDSDGGSDDSDDNDSDGDSGPGASRRSHFKKSKRKPTDRRNKKSDENGHQPMEQSDFGNSFFKLAVEKLCPVRNEARVEYHKKGFIYSGSGNYVRHTDADGQRFELYPINPSRPVYFKESEDLRRLSKEEGNQDLDGSVEYAYDVYGKKYVRYIPKAALKMAIYILSVLYGSEQYYGHMKIDKEL